MANMIDLLITSTFVVLTILKTSVAGIVPLNVEQSENPFVVADHSNYLVRDKRDAYFSPSDYYANYYNDYYNNYYNQPSQGYNTNVRPSRPVAGSADRFDGNNFDRDDFDNNVVSSNGIKYVYTPIFKYKSTQQKKHKLFVPNLFG